MSDHRAPRYEDGGERGTARTAPVDPADLAWILLLPAVVIATLLIALLAAPGGRLLLPDPGYDYWAGPGIRKATVDVGYLLFVAGVAVYAAAIVKLAGVRLDSRARRIFVVVAQVACAAFVVACWIGQGRIRSLGNAMTYFTPATLVVAALAAAAVALLVRERSRRPRERDPLARLRRADTPVVRAACLGTAVLVAVVWLLPAIHTDESTPHGATYLGVLFFDESAAVVNGRSPFVDMVAYATIWPYLVALPLSAFGTTYAVFTVAMVTITTLALVAIYDLLRRVVRNPLLALALYLPVLANGFFLTHELEGDRYHPGTYFGMFPLRYAGPYLLAWLTAWHLSRREASRWSLRLLLMAGGLVALNNTDFGGAALAGTVAAVVVVRRPASRPALGRLALDLLVGLALALALVCGFTLVRAGSLPHFELLTRYGRVFVDGGFANLPLPGGFGLHLVVSATFVAAAATAAVRVARAARDDLLGGMLAWCALFGLGASFYYYAYRSHPDVLVTLFPVWSLTLALLVVAALRDASRARARLGAPAIAAVFALAIAGCSLAQVPAPWTEVARIGEPTLSGQPPTVLAGGFRQADVRRIVAERTEPGEPVAIISPIGHRVAVDAGVVNVSPYAGLEQMPAREQTAETVEILRREGGTKLYLAQERPPGLDVEMQRLGMADARAWRVNNWPETAIYEYRVG